VVESNLVKAFQDRVLHYSDRLTVAWLKSFDPKFNAEQYNRLRRELEQLKFDADTFGFDLIVNCIDEILPVVVPFDTGVPTEEFETSLYRQLSVLFQILDEHTPVVGTVNEDSSMKTSEVTALIYILDDSQSHLTALTAQIELFSYKVITFKKIDELCVAIKQLMPAAIVADVVIEEGLTPDIWVKNFETHGLVGAKIPPVIFMSAHDVSLIRMKCVRAGGCGFATKPINMNKLIAQLDSVTGRYAEEAYRVLIIDDQASQAQYHALLLQEAQCQVEVSLEVEDALDKVMRFRPDVILMDLYMPGFTGLEVAIAIRQRVEYSGIQILFLSSEKNTQTQKEILVTAGEAFLEKPIEPNYLVRIVQARAGYSRRIGNVMARDSLTNLYNHAEIKRHIKVESSRASRNSKPLSLVMLDIDLFKNVNDSYGHIVGDQVLKTLALLLSDSLRRTDLVGRYGGEEFLILMPDTDAKSAKEVIEWLLEKFTAISNYGEAHFSCSFSAGIAEFKGGDATDNTLQQADQLMYEAKEHGRNQVVTEAFVDQAILSHS